MIIERTHDLPKDEVRRRLDQTIDSLVANPPSGVDVSDVIRTWNGDVLTFSFKAGKRVAFLGSAVTVSGTITVTDRDLRLQSELPGLAKTFIGEERIRRVLEQELDSRILGRA